MHNFTIRRETDADISAIREVAGRAFTEFSYAQYSEQEIVESLRDKDALVVSLIAVAGPFVVGHLAASAVTISDGTEGWVSIGPLSVAPNSQGRGAGSALVTAALDQLREAGIGGVVAVGDPAFYGRFGFAVAENLTHPGAIPGTFMARPICDARVPSGQVRYHPVFRRS